LETKQYEEFEYKVIEDSVTIVKYTGHYGVVHVPDRINNITVTKIGKEAFRDCKFISKVTLPYTIEVLESYSFCGCNGLTEFYFGDKIISIGSHAFYNCRGVSEIYLPGDIKDIGDGAFKNCDKISKINVRTKSEKILSIKHPLEGLLHDVTVKIVYEIEGKEERAALLFPKDEVFYSYYTTRLNDKTTFGVGNHYHNCIGNGSIDYTRYDSLFSGAKNQLPSEVLLQIALLRVMYPYKLDEESNARYLLFMNEHMDTVTKKAIQWEDMEVLKFFASKKLMREVKIDEYIEYALNYNKIECTSFLLTYKNKNYNKRNLEFEL
jgi:hypothetical protein